MLREQESQESPVGKTEKKKERRKGNAALVTWEEQMDAEMDVGGGAVAEERSNQKLQQCASQCITQEEDERTNEDTE